MNKKCKKCDNTFNTLPWIDGKKRYLHNRKFCFKCSPFGKHNTRALDKNIGPALHTSCNQCGKYFATPQKKRAKCNSCYFKNKQRLRIDKVKNITGDSCWFCGYNKLWGNLCFHHVNPEEKTMGLTTRELSNYKWSKVYSELKKCVLCCHNCHGEIHGKLISEKIILEKYDFWKDF